MDNQLMIDHLGRYYPCCHYAVNPKLGTSGQHDDICNPYDTESNDYSTVDSYRKTINRKHELLKQGERIPECHFCWMKEDDGVISLREQSIIDAELYNWPVNQPGKIIKLDIRLHNKCNLACTMCWSGVSSLWGKLEGKKDNEIIIEESQINLINNHLEDLRFLTLQGGEPFYGHEYTEFIDSIPNKQNIVLDFFTNLTVVKLDAVKRWKDQYKRLFINVSVDGIEQVYDSIRWPASWSKFEKNAFKTYEILGQQMRYFYTVQAQNLVCLTDFIEWAKQNTPGCSIVLPKVFYPESLSISCTTQEERDIFLEKIRKMDLEATDHDYDVKELTEIIESVTSMKDDPEKIEKRNEYIKNVYKLRADYK